MVWILFQGVCIYIYIFNYYYFQNETFDFEILWISMKPNFSAGGLSMWEARQALQAGMTVLLLLHVLLCTYSPSALSACTPPSKKKNKVNSPCWGSRYSWPKEWLFTAAILMRQHCAISSTVFSKLAFQLSGPPHLLSNPKRTMLSLQLISAWPCSHKTYTDAASQTAATCVGKIRQNTKLHH